MTITRRLRSLGITLGFLATSLLAACGGGSGSSGLAASSGSPASSGCTNASCGTALITMTDADGDFSSYTVDVTALTLKKANGTVVQLLPATTRIDFAQLVTLSELLAAAPIPIGDYVSGSITVDYTNASVFVESGGTPKAAKVVDANGAALGVVQVDLQLDPAHPFAIGPGARSHLALDFNLAATNTVDLTTTPATVMARPVFVASLAPPDSRELRVRGGLATVDDTASTFTVNVKPFDDHGTDRGTLTVHVNAQTAYEINGQTSTGTAGLAALKALAAGTMTAAFGSLQLSDKTFTATRVLAGTSLEAPDSDRLGGTVIARSGDTLTVRGATLGRRDGKVAFQASDITLKVGTGTTVTREGSTGGALTAAAISVGQRISAAGTASTDAAGKTTLDASAGSVRLGVTAAWGLVKTATAGTLTLTLQSLDGRPASVFNFAGTGNGAAQDASAANYRIGTGTLSLAALVAGKPARVYGFVTPFGSAPPDFNASALVDYSATLATLDIEWKDGGATAPFSAMAASGLVVDKTNTLLADDSVRIGPQRIDLAALPAGVRIVAAGQSTDSFAIGTDQRQVTMYTSFADFVTALTAKLNGSGKLRHLDAQGSYESASNTFTASRLVVVISGG